MKRRVLIIICTDDETGFTAGLADAYKRGVVKEGAAATIVNIARIHFTHVINAYKVTLRELDADLKMVRNMVLESDHLVFIIDVQKSVVNFKLASFYDRLFSLQGGLPLKNLWRTSDFTGKTARIISVLDGEAWREYKQEGRQISYNPIKKQALQLLGIAVVRTTSLGSVKKGIHNDYYYKWINKMQLLGEKQY
ncbi:NAD(P)H-dependent oxidoreductase [Chitinophagaceae bacterium MMS25-I14]